MSSGQERRIGVVRNILLPRAYLGADIAEPAGVPQAEISPPRGSQNRGALVRRIRMDRHGT
jgi:hypothetical protein